LLGRSRPRRAVDLTRWPAATAASPPWPLAPLLATAAGRGSRVAARSLNHVALPSLRRACAASPRAWAPVACPPCAVASSAPAGLPSLLRTVPTTRTRSASSSACYHPFSIPLVHGFGLTSFGQATPPRLKSRHGRRQFWRFPSGEPIRAYRCALKGSRPADRLVASLLLLRVRLEPLVAQCT
jgi:hypothetical protein